MITRNMNKITHIHQKYDNNRLHIYRAFAGHAANAWYFVYFSIAFSIVIRPLITISCRLRNQEYRRRSETSGTRSICPCLEIRCDPPEPSCGLCGNKIQQQILIYIYIYICFMYIYIKKKVYIYIYTEREIYECIYTHVYRIYVCSVSCNAFMY